MCQTAEIHPLLHGADYNPEQWLHSPEVLAEDIRLMRKAGFNCVSLGIFSWAELEPEEGVYRFDWLAQVIDSLHQNGIGTILATPSGARPPWLAQKYPEVLRVGPNGQRNSYGGRHNHCYTSPIYRQKVAAINRELALRLGGHPGVFLWHLSNEYGGECFCPLCAEAFRRWLEARYGSLDALSHAWWTRFWSHRFTSWQQIEPPFENGEQELQGLALDWMRFVTSQTVDFCAMEKAALREAGSSLPVTTNMMRFYPGLDYHAFRDVIDLASWDSYPRWHNDPLQNFQQAAITACFHSLVRGLKRQPFLMMESSPSSVNWMDASKLKKPGLHAAEGLLAVAQGSNSVQYFQWRKSRGGFEKFHGAVVSHDGRSDTRVFTDVEQLGGRLQALGGLYGTMPKAKVAILYDWENAWALRRTSGPRTAGIPYDETVVAHFKALWQLGITADVLDAEDDLSAYSLVAAPLLYLQSEKTATTLCEFVKAGGTLVVGCLHGSVDESDLCHLGDIPAGQTELFGLRVEEVDGLWPGEVNQLCWQGGEYQISALCERIIPEGAEVLAEYTQDFYKGQPALTRQGHGGGSAYYLACLPEEDFYLHFYAQLAKTLALPRAMEETLPQGVVAQRRGACVFLQNFSGAEASLPLARPWADAETGKALPPELVLQSYETRVLKEI